MAALHRILVLGGGFPAYVDASEQEKRDVFLPRFRALLAEWEELGARVVASFCDDVLQVGSVSTNSWAWYLIFEVDELETVGKMIERVRAEVGALDYKPIVSIAGPGAIQAPGMIPSMFLGSLPQKDAIKQNLTKAKAALAASGVASQQVTLEYPSDLTINGVPFTTMAQRVQANLQSAGFNVTLSGSPTSNWLTKYRDGKMAFGLSLCGPDYPDPADYLAFTPGQLVGLRAGWPAGSDAAIEKLASKALVTTAAAARKSIYQRIQLQLNQRARPGMMIDGSSVNVIPASRASRPRAR